MSNSNLPAGLRRAMKQAQAKCLQCLPQVDYFETLATAMPEIEEQALRLRTKHEHLTKLTAVGLGAFDGLSPLESTE